MKKISGMSFLILLAGASAVLAQASAMRGLWVGEARLNYATEVTVPLDEDNIPRAPDPERPTRTFDVANIRLILHVNGAGQVSLLKEVALLRKTDDILAGESDISLITDPRLFPEFPAQIGQRIASVVFDFGDQKATDAVQAVMDAAVEAASSSINGVTNLASQTEAVQAQALADATAAAQAAAQAVVDGADAEERFNTFLQNNLSSTQVDAIAMAADPAAAAAGALAAAEALRDDPDSFYADGRAVEMVNAIVAAVEAIDDAGGTLTPEEVEEARKAAAQNTAAAYADVDNEYNRFLAGKIFGDLIAPVASAAAEFGVLRTVQGYSGVDGSVPVEVLSPGHGLIGGEAIVLSGASIAAYNGTHTITKLSDDAFSIPVEYVAGGTGGAWKHETPTILAAAEAVPEENDAQAEAIAIKVAGYNDTRGADAVATVVAAMVAAAEASELESVTLLTAALVEVGQTALANDVVRFPVPEMAPTGDYSDFVRAANVPPQETETFLTSPAIAAAAAAQGAFDESVNNPLSTPSSVRNKALAAAANALEKVFAAAARANRTELPMDGTFAVGEGDPRLKGELNPGEVLGLAGLEGSVVLPAMHPTNPFRHRRHPDHTVGFDIVRKLRLDFDGEPNDPLDSAGFGVTRITGTYREEITKPENRVQGGLHKPLGPDQDRGLTVEGKFELSRISLIDALNAH